MCSRKEKGAEGGRQKPENGTRSVVVSFRESDGGWLEEVEHSYQLRMPGSKAPRAAPKDPLRSLMKQMDLKVFVDTDDDVRLSRKVLKIARKHPDDKAHLSDFLSKYENFVKPSFEKFIEPTKKYADIILPNYGFSTEDKLDIDAMHIPAIDLIIKRVLNENIWANNKRCLQQITSLFNNIYIEK